MQASRSMSLTGDHPALCRHTRDALSIVYAAIAPIQHSEAICNVQAYLDV